MSTISNTDNIIDSRDIVKRIEELEDELEALTDVVKELQEQISDASMEDILGLSQELTDKMEELQEWNDDNKEELESLVSFRDECENCNSDFSHGESLIHENYFTEYCQELVVDIGDMPKNIPSYIAIDWEQTADNLKADYSEVTWDGESYYIRDC